MELFCKKKIHVDSDLDIWYEAKPIPPRKGRAGRSEGNTRLDLAFGSIRLREDTQSGIEYDPNKKVSWVCFVESKLFSDCSTDTTYCPLRNQIIRVIENLLCFQGNCQFPQKLFFTLLTPRLFEKQRKSRLYGYKMEEYENPGSIVNDISLSSIEQRKQADWHYPESLKDRVKRLDINWMTYEEIFEKEYDLSELDLTKLREDPENNKRFSDILGQLAEHL